MGKEEFKAVLEGMINDADMAENVASGDFGDLTEDQLSGAERALLSAAAGDLDDDVTGFGDSYMKLGDLQETGYTEVEWTYVEKGPDMRRAFDYLSVIPKLDRKS